MKANHGNRGAVTKRVLRISRSCEFCHKEYTVIDNSKNLRFCSFRCWGEYQHRNMLERIEREKIERSKRGNTAWNKGLTSKVPGSCQICGKEFMHYERNPRKFCSRKCYFSSDGYRERARNCARHLKREIKGRIVNNGYWYVYSPDHPRAKKTAPSGYVYEHILVAEKMVGRNLNDYEIVHHINHDKKDNRPENLVITTRKEHHLYHPEWKDNIKTK